MTLELLSTPTMEEKLPSPLIRTEILTKLPVKSLLRFRCVSKPWKSTIDDPHFIKLHLKHSLETLTNHTLIFLKNFSLCSVDFTTLKKATKIENPTQKENFKIAVVGSSHGLLCLIGQDIDSDPVIFNPATKQSKEVKVTFSEGEHYFKGITLEEVVAHGFGYDHINDDYKLLRIVQFSVNYEKIYREVNVYSLNKNSWTNVSDLSDEYVFLRKRDCGVYVNGCLHYIIAKSPILDMLETILVAFDLGSLKWNIVAQPGYCDGPDWSSCWVAIGVVGGCLSMGCNYPMDRSEVWVMKEYGVEKSWSKVFVLSESLIGCSLDRVLPIAYLKDCSKVLIVQEDVSKLFWFDLERKTIENVMKIPGKGRASFQGMLVESLVSLGSQEIKKFKKRSFLSKGFKLKL